MAAALGADNVFLDVSNIEPGRDFIREIEDVVGTCAYCWPLLERTGSKVLLRRAGAESIILGI
jgi:hypothetical protein